VETKKAIEMAAIETKEDITIELSSRPAYRLWSGREKTTKKYGILGLPGFCKIMRGIEESVRHDDPYADYHYHVIEKSIEALAFDLDIELKDIKTFIVESIPAAMSLPSTGSKSPVVLPVRFAARLGFQLVYQILKVDEIVLKVLLASHVGILPNKEKFETIARVEKRVRSVINLVFRYQHTGVTRDDMASNNQKAQQAKEKMGSLEKGYLEGTTRSDNAPPLPIKRLQSLTNVVIKGNSDKSSKKKKINDTVKGSEVKLDVTLDESLEEKSGEKSAVNV